MIFDELFKLIFLLTLWSRFHLIVDGLNESVLENYISGTNEMRKHIDKIRDRYDSVEITSPEEHPYAVMLFIFIGAKYLGCCSGSLVTLEWILTSASHCFRFKGTTHVQVYAGGNSEKEWLDKTYTEGYQLRNTSQFFIHPRYEREEFYVSYFDLALVKVRKFRKTGTVSTIKIYPKPWKFKDFTSCSLTGFGKYQFGEKHADDFARKTYYLEAHSPCVCLDTSKTKRKNWICSKPRKDFGICGSDWGAALVCNGKIRGVAVSVISFKDLDTCSLDDHREYVCASDKTLSIFQNTFPCIEWMNIHLKRFRVASTNGSNLQRGACIGFIMTVIFQSIILTLCNKVYNYTQ